MVAPKGNIPGTSQAVKTAIAMATLEPPVTEGECLAEASAATYVPAKEVSMTATLPDVKIGSFPAQRFSTRHIGPQADDREKMLAALGLPSLEQLVDESLPNQSAAPSHLLAARTVRVRDLGGAARLRQSKSAADIDDRPRLPRHRDAIGDPPERTRIASLVYRLYALPARNKPGAARGLAQLPDRDLRSHSASHGRSKPPRRGDRCRRGTTLARRGTKTGQAILLDGDTLPQSIGVVTTRAAALGIEVVVASKPLIEAIEEIDLFAVMVQTPGASGRLASTEELRTIADRAHARGAMVIAACDLMALTLMTPPGEWGADVAVGSSQRFGVPLFYGGPHAGFISVRAGLERTYPGGWSGCPRIATARPASAWHCKPGSSTFVVRKRPRTSVPPRSCLP